MATQMSAVTIVGTTEAAYATACASSSSTSACAAMIIRVETVRDVLHAGRVYTA